MRLDLLRVFSPLLLQLPFLLIIPLTAKLSHLRGFALAVLFAQNVLYPDLCMACTLTPVSNVFLQRPSLTSLPKRTLLTVLLFFLLALITT